MIDHCGCFVTLQQKNIKAAQTRIRQLNEQVALHQEELASDMSEELTRQV